MPNEIILSPAGRVTVGLDVNGTPVEIMARTGATLGPPNLTFGRPVPNGLPVVVAVPAGATHIEICQPGGQSQLLAAGSRYIRQADLGAEPDASRVATRMRAVRVEGAAVVAVGRWVERILIWLAERPTSPVISPITVEGVPQVSTTGIVGSPINVTSWPTPSRAGLLDPELWQFASADAVNDVTPVATAKFTQGMAVPAQPARWFEIVYQLFDIVFQQWVRVRSARYDINEVGLTGPITAADITWAPRWVTVDGRRQLITADFTIAAMATTAQVQTCVRTRKYRTPWVDTTLVSGGPARTFGADTIPADFAGAGAPLYQFPRDREDRSEILFRWRPVAGTGVWNESSVALEMPLPAGPGLEPNALVTTEAEFEAAIADVIGSSALRIIALDGEIAIPDMTITARVKPGRELIICSLDPDNPAVISGYDGICLQLIRCQNIEIDGIVFASDRLKWLGGTHSGGTMTPIKNPAGHSIRTGGCQRIWIENCIHSGNDNAIEFRDSDRLHVGWNDVEFNGQDAIRFFWRGSNAFLEGLRYRDALVYEPWTRVTISALYHIDWMQIAVKADRQSGRNDVRAGGWKGVRIEGCMILGNEQEYMTFLCGNELLRDMTLAWNPPSAAFLDGLNTDFVVRDTYVEAAHGHGPIIHCTDGVLLERYVLRRLPNTPSNRNPSIQPGRWLRDMVLNDCVLSNGFYFPGGPGMTTAQLQAQITQNNVQQNNTSFPSGWPSAAAQPIRKEAFQAGFRGFRRKALYVAPAGNDANPGTPASPKATIAAALAAAGPWDEVIVRAGTYSGAVTVSKHGQQLRAFPGETAILEGTGTPAATDMVTIAANYVRVEGFEIRNATRHGVNVGSFKSAHIRGNRIHDCQGSAIKTGGATRTAARRHKIMGNRCWNCCLSNSGKNAATWPAVIDISNSDNTIARLNKVFDSYGDGIRVLSTNRALITENYVWDCCRDGIRIDNSPGTAVQENFSFHTADAAYYLSGASQVPVRIVNGAATFPLATTDISAKLNTCRGALPYYDAAVTPGGGISGSALTPNTQVSTFQAGWIA